mgnify:CR=1 FL=1
MPLWENTVIYPDTQLISDAQIQFRQYFPFGKAPLLTPTLNLFPILKKKKNAPFVKTEGRKKKKRNFEKLCIKHSLIESISLLSSDQHNNHI